MAAHAPTISQVFLDECQQQLQAKFEKIEHCLKQLNEEQVWWRPHEEANSIGNIILHLCGNMRQWVLHGIGGAADERDRPAEFAEHGRHSRDELLHQLRDVIGEVAVVLQATTSEDLLKMRRIQGFDVNGLSAIFDSVSHLVGHTQEIIYITRLQLGHAYGFHWQPSTPEEGA